MTSSRNERIEKPQEMPELKRAILMKCYQQIQNTPDDNKWREWKSEFVYEGKTYTTELQYKLDNTYFKYKNFHIEHKQVIIDITDQLGVQ